MHLPDMLQGLDQNAILCVEMHTTGEPTRIVYQGYPQLHGTLLEQRAQTRRDHDNIRKRLLLEPRGHNDMYGAILRPFTELVDRGEAHLGVLFMTNDGYSTMCGHATIALGRFLVDTHDPDIFPKREQLRYDPATKTTRVTLHAPCGLLEVTVPTLPDGRKAGASRNVSFLSVPSFAPGLQIRIDVPPELRWPQLGPRTHVTADIGYGGTYYLIVSATELGFPHDHRAAALDLGGLDLATKHLKTAANADASVRALLQHSDHADLGFLYAVMVVDSPEGSARTAADEELGFCFFADRQFDRSPTGSGVAARVAVAFAKGERAVGQSWTYHSVVSRAYGGDGAFVGTPIEGVDVPVPNAQGGLWKGVRVRVEGKAYYTGFHSFVREEGDVVGQQGFDIRRLGV